MRNESLKVSSLYNTAPAGIDRLCALSTGGSVQNANVTTDGSQLLTAEDMALNNLPDVKVLKKVRLTYDYSLCPQTLNSLGMNFNNSPATIQTGPGGKLTLKAVQTFGQGNVSLIPATRFEYDAAPLFTTVKVNTPQVGGIASVANVTFTDNTLSRVTNALFSIA